MSSEGYYDNIGDLKMLVDDDPNLPIIKNHLEAGWVLKKVPEVDVPYILNKGTVQQTEALRRVSKFFLVLPKSSGSSSPPPTTAGESTSPRQPDDRSKTLLDYTSKMVVKLQGLPFREFSKDGRSWHSVGPNDIPEDVFKFLQSQDGWKYEDEDGYIFTLSKGWINRKKK